jgi:phage head maturation protease
MMATSGFAGYIPSKAPEAQESIGRQHRVKLMLDVNGLGSGLTPVKDVPVGSDVLSGMKDSTIHLHSLAGEV